MTEELRRAYLRAMGLDVWLLRWPDAEAGFIGIGTGRDSTLLLCPSASDCGTELAGDIARALGGDPVWAWLDPAPDEAAQMMQQVVAERLITRILVFGPETARRAFAGEVPQTLASATVVALPGLDELASSRAAKRALWRQLQVPYMVPQDRS